MQSQKSRPIDVKKSIWFWGTLIPLLSFLFIAPFHRALFNGGQTIFDGPIFAFHAVISISFFFLGLFLASNNKKHKSDRIGLLQHAIWLLPLFYALALFSSASDFFGAYGLWNALTYGSLFVIGSTLATHTYSRRLLAGGIYISSYLIVIFGLMNWFGNASFWGLFDWSKIGGSSSLYKDAVMIDSNGERLTSVFQYANTYAAFLIAVILSSLFIVVGSKNRYAVVLSSLLFVPGLLSFVLTLSRGGLVVFPVIFLLVLPFLSFARQLLALLHIAIASIAAFLILTPITNMGLELQGQFTSGGAAKAWGLLLLVSIAVSVVAYSIQTFLAPRWEEKIESWNRKKYMHFLLPAVGVVAAALVLYLLLGNSGFIRLLPDNLQTRVENINLNQHSVLERGTFYQDSLKLWRDYPLTGAGGGAWQTMYEKYQNNPYTSRQAHNYFLQTLVEIGFLGLITLLGIIGIIVYHFIKSYWKKAEDNRLPFLIFFAFAISILIHSFIDFNMSYVYLSGIVFLCLGGMLAANELPSFDWQHRIGSTIGWRWTAPVVTFGISAVTLLLAMIHLSGHSQFAEARANATQGGATLESITKPLNSAIGKLAHPEFVDLKLQVLNTVYEQSKDESFAEEANELLGRMKEKEPYYKAFVYRELQLLIMKSEYGTASALLERRIPDYPWDIQLFEELANVHYLAGLAQIQNNEVVAGKAEWDKATALLDRVNEKAKVLEALPDAQLQGRAFGLTPNLALPLGQIAFYKGEYPQAEQYIQLRLDPNYDEQKDFEAAIYYIASLRKQGRDDAALLQDLLSNLELESQQQVKDQIAALEQQPAISN